jgi:hypothetical protein
MLTIKPCEKAFRVVATYGNQILRTWSQRILFGAFFPKWRSTIVRLQEPSSAI